MVEFKLLVSCSLTGLSTESSRFVFFLFTLSYLLASSWLMLKSKFLYDEINLLSALVASLYRSGQQAGDSRRSSSASRHIENSSMSNVEI